MRKVKLYTRDGGYVTTAVIPPFLDGNMPEVLIWGTRTFSIRDNGDFYVECFTVAVVQTED